jgi:trigger factor
MPVREGEDQQLDPENPQPLEFTYRIGFAPRIDTDLSQETFKYYKVKVDDELVDQQVQDICKRYGTLIEVEEVDEEDMVTGEFKELDENGNVKEDGIQHRSSVVLTAIDDEEARKQLLGLKKGDEVDVDPNRLSKGEQDLASMLNIEKERARELDSKFRLEVQDIRRMQPAELDQELFDKVLGEGEVSSEEEFRDRIRQQLEDKFEPESDKLLQKQVLEQLMEKQDLDLPDEHLKEWIKVNNKNPISDEQLEEEYDNYARNLKWQLIENQLIQENEIKVEEQDAVNYTKTLLQRQYDQYGIPHPSDEEMEQSARQILQDQNEGEQIFQNLYGYRLIEYFKENLELDVQEVSYDEFLKLAQAEQGEEAEETNKSEQEQTTT